MSNRGFGLLIGKLARIGEPGNDAANNEMIVLNDLKKIPEELLGGCVAVGNFDGIHKGHASLVSQLVELAQELDGSAIVITFNPPPIALLNPEIPLLPPVTTIVRRAELLADLGVHALVTLPTSFDLLSLSAKHFFEGILLDQLQIRGMVEGPNFRFGKGRAGDTILLGKLCRTHQIALRIINPADDSEGMISSSRIRKYLSEGNIARVNSMLTRPFRLSGIVDTGAGRGKQVLVPTANLTQVDSLIPAQGVYGGIVRLDGHAYRAAVNIGPNPTFGETIPKVEIHVLQWQGDLYGQSLDCDLICWIRGIQKFESKEALLTQIRADIEQIERRVEI